MFLILLMRNTKHFQDKYVSHSYEKQKPFQEKYVTLRKILDMQVLFHYQVQSSSS